MEWLAPLTGLYAAAVAMPLLVLMYFLKLKRQDQFVSSTFLWKRAVQDLQVNAPFQKLRRNILLLLQLLILLAILLALAGPAAFLTAGQARRYVLLIDRSASMNATDVEPSRLEAAKSQAKTLVESLRGRAAFSLTDSSDQAMVIAFDDHAKLMCNFTSDKRRLIAAIDSIEPTDGGSSLLEAVTVARAFAQPDPDASDEQSALPAAQLELFSDGQIADSHQIVVGSKELNFHRLGESSANVALVAMQARRSYEKADQVNVFATLANYASSAVTCDVQLSIDGNVRSVRSVTIGPCTSPDASDDSLPGQVSLSFTLTHPGAGLLEVKHLFADPVASDNTAWAVLPPPKRLAVLMVTSGNVSLSSALKACPLASLDQCTPSDFKSMDFSTTESYDVIVLDCPAPADLPRGRYLVFGSPPPDIGVSTPRQLQNQVLVDWRGQHPVLQFVNLSNLFAVKCHELILPRDALTLAEFGSCPAMAVVRRGGSAFLLVGFDPADSNWPFEPGFVMFCYNATAFLGLEIGRDRQTSLRVGQAITVENLPPDAPVEIFGPDAADTDFATDSSGVLRYPATHRCGIYTVKISDRLPEQFAVNLLDSAESDIAPADEIVLSGLPVHAQSTAPRRANVQLWSYLAVLALALVCLEWFVYNSKSRL